MAQCPRRYSTQLGIGADKSGSGLMTCYAFKKYAWQAVSFWEVVMKIDGGCHCGYIAYEAEADPEAAIICNCTDCQTLSGSAFRTVLPTRLGSFKLRSGELKIYVKIGESGTARPQSFCPNCGTPIYSTTAGQDPKVYFLRLGTVRQRDQFTPKFQIWSRSSQRWINDIGSIRAIEKQPAFTASGAVPDKFVNVRF